jgi:hypothetical protein
MSETPQTPPRQPRPGFWKTFGLFMLWFVMPMTAFMEMTKQFSRNDDPNKR